MVLGISGQGGTFQFTSQAVVVTFFMKINRLLIYILRRTFESVAIKLQYIYNAPAEFVCVLMDKATFIPSIDIPNLDGNWDGKIRKI